MRDEDLGEDDGRDELLRLTVEVVSSFVSYNNVPPSEISELIRVVHRALGQLKSPDADKSSEALKPAIPVAKSVNQDYIVCLEDGKRLKMLKRYLRSTYGMTPDDYRKRWNLPADYPMVAPAYAARRSETAKRIGLGKGVRRKT